MLSGLFRKSLRRSGAPNPAAEARLVAYQFSWHARHGAMTDSSARVVMEQLASFLPLRSVLDVGCGDGRWLRRCSALQVDTTLGVDGAWTRRDALCIDEDRVVVRDLEQPFDLGRRFDLVISLEVAEHLPPAAAETFVANLVAHGDCVLFGAAIPFQGGFRHVNERWQSYWAGLFDRHELQVFDVCRARLWSRTDVHFWYKQNMLLFVSRRRPDLLQAVCAHIERERIQQLPLDIVHPDKYAAIASYRQIAFKPLLRELPMQAITKARSLLTGNA